MTQDEGDNEGTTKEVRTRRSMSKRTSSSALNATTSKKTSRQYTKEGPKPLVKSGHPVPDSLVDFKQTIHRK